MKKGNRVLPWVVFGVLLILVVVLIFVFRGVFESGQAINTATSLSSVALYTKIDVRPVLCESYYLSTATSRLYVGDSINKVKSIVTDSEFPGLLEDRLDYINTSIQSTQTLVIGRSMIENDTGNVHIQIGATPSNTFYNYSFTFNRAVDFTSPDSIGEWIKMMGQDFAVGADTNPNDLVLYRSAQQVDLSLGGVFPIFKAVNVENKIYTVELITISEPETSAVIKVTDSNGGYDTKEISEGTAKKVQGLEVALVYADTSEVNSSMTVQLLVGAQRYELTNGMEVKQGSDEEPMDGTNVVIRHSGNWSSTTSFLINFFASDSANDELGVYQRHTNSMFSNLKLIFESYDNTNGAMIKIGGCVWGKSCVDSDGGDVPLTKGTLTYWVTNATDSCNSGSTLLEYYCGIGNEGWTSVPVVADYACTYGCVNGACKQAPAGGSSCVYNKKLRAYVCS